MKGHSHCWGSTCRTCLRSQFCQRNQCPSTWTCSSRTKWCHLCCTDSDWGFLWVPQKHKFCILRLIRHRGKEQDHRPFGFGLCPRRKHQSLLKGSCRWVSWWVFSSLIRRDYWLWSSQNLNRNGREGLLQKMSAEWEIRSVRKEKWKRALWKTLWMRLFCKWDYGEWGYLWRIFCMIEKVNIFVLTIIIMLTCLVALHYVKVRQRLDILEFGRFRSFGFARDKFEFPIPFYTISSLWSCQLLHTLFKYLA